MTLFVFVGGEHASFGESATTHPPSSALSLEDRAIISLNSLSNLADYSKSPSAPASAGVHVCPRSTVKVLEYFREVKEEIEEEDVHGVEAGLMEKDKVCSTALEGIPRQDNAAASSTTTSTTTATTTNATTRSGASPGAYKYSNFVLL